jgi:hypothetical protein
VLAFCFILFSGTAVMAADVTQAQVNAAVLGGQNYLKAQQQPGGYWQAYGYPVAETAAALIALLETGVPRTDPVVVAGINYIKSQVRANGSIFGGTSYAVNYETGLSLVALDLYNDPAAAVKLIAENAMNFLISGQNRGNEADTYYGGWRYYFPPGGDSDLSVTQFVVMGLYYGSHYRGISVAGQVWVAPLKKFLQRAAVPGGGFSYTPGGGTYYSMTGAGFWCSAMAGLEADPVIAPLLDSAKAWFNTNYGWDQDAYYIYAMAKGLAAAVGTETLIGVHNWVQDLKNMLVDPANGKIQTAAARDTQNYWDMGYDRILSTAWVLTNLAFADPNTPSPNKRIADELDNPIKGTVTLSTQNGVLIAGAIRQPIANAQKGITVKLPIGAMSFTLLNMRVGGCTDLRIDVPDVALDWHNEDSFINRNGTIKAGLSWFKVQAGAWKGNASIPIQIVFNVPGDPSKGGYILVTLCDGAPYDEDLSLNGQYKDPGAPGVGGNPPDEPTNVPGVSTGAGSGCFIKTVGGVPTAGGFMALALVLLLGLAVFRRPLAKKH